MEEPSLKPLDGPQPGARPRARTRLVRPPALPMRQVLFGLFFDPGVLAVLQHDRWSRAFRVMAAASFLSGLLVGVSKVPRIVEATRDWAAWLRQEVGALRLHHGELSWDRPAALPYTTRHRGWRVDFVSPGAAFAGADDLGPEGQGIWFGPERVCFWWRTESSPPRVTQVPILDGNKVWGLFDVDRVWPNGLEVRGEEFDRGAERLIRQGVPVLLLHEGIVSFLQVLLYTLVFAAIPVLLRSPLAAGGFGRVFTFYLYASVPPVLVAAVYASLNLPYLDHTLVFVTGFVLYLALVVRGLVRDGDAPSPRDADP